MDNKQKRFYIEANDIKIAISILICILTYHFVPQLQILSAATAALMCTQDTEKLSFKSGVTRTLGTIIAGLIAVAVLAIDSVIGNFYVLAVLVGVGIALALAILRAMNVPAVVARVGAVTVVLITIITNISAKAPISYVSYGVNRVIATAFGALVATGVSYIVNLVAKKKKVPVNK